MPVRFETRYDGWLVALLVAAALVPFAALAAPLFFVRARPAPPAGLIMAAVVWLAALLRMLPQYYEVRADGMFLRQGWKRALIPYAALSELRFTDSVRSAPVFSTHRTLLFTAEGKQFIIAVADEDRFLTEVARRCPHLVRRPTGLGLPLTSSVA